MAGHSKWANIQHRKKAQDAKRGKLFTRLIREVVVAAKAGGSDLDANPSLRTAVDKAKSQSVPKDAIERAVKRGAGELEGSDYEEIRYEGYGPAGVAFIVDCLSDNRNRTVAEVRHAFSKAGGNLGQSGSVAYLFSSVGVLLYSPEHDTSRRAGPVPPRKHRDLVTVPAAVEPLRTTAARGARRRARSASARCRW